MYDKFAAWTFSGATPSALTKDEMLDDNDNNFNAVEQKTADIKVPVG